MKTAVALFSFLLVAEAAAAAGMAQVCFDGQLCPNAGVITNEISNTWTQKTDASITEVRASAAARPSPTLPGSVSFNNVDVTGTLAPATISATRLVRLSSSSLPTCNASQAGTIRRSGNKACWCDGGGTWRRPDCWPY